MKKGLKNLIIREKKKTFLMVQRFKLMIMSGLLMHHSSAKIIKKRKIFILGEKEK